MTSGEYLNSNFSRTNFVFIPGDAHTSYLGGRNFPGKHGANDFYWLTSNQKLAYTEAWAIDEPKSDVNPNNVMTIWKEKNFMLDNVPVPDAGLHAYICEYHYL